LVLAIGHGYENSIDKLEAASLHPGRNFMDYACHSQRLSIVGFVLLYGIDFDAHTQKDDRIELEAARWVYYSYHNVEGERKLEE
jgi:hypothetical protein